MNIKTKTISNKEFKLRVVTAKVAGAKAFKDGKKCTPVLDNNYIFLLAGLGMGTGQSIPIKKSWLKGWYLANLETVEVTLPKHIVNPFVKKIEQTLTKSGFEIESYSNGILVLNTPASNPSPKQISSILVESINFDTNLTKLPTGVFIGTCNFI